MVQNTVGYLPTINTPSTEMSTVNEDPTQTLNIMETLGLNESVCVFDQVFYVKTEEITWKHDKFKNSIFRMVAFHTIPFETSYIDHREEVSGCWPPRLVCGVCCDGRAQIQSCWQASQDRVRGDVEASRLEIVLLWINANHGAEVRHLENVLKIISTFHDEVSQTSFTAHMDDGSRSRMIKEHIGAIWISNPLTAFWTSYNGMADITLGWLLAARYW